MASEINASTRLPPTSTAMRQRQLERARANRAQEERVQEYRALQQAQQRQAELRAQQSFDHPPAPVLNAQGQATGRLLNVQA